MLRSIDDFLIERVHQPIADLFARHVSCYGIASFLFMGALLGMTMGSVMRGAYVSAVMNAWLVFPVLRCESLDKSALIGVMPANRVTEFFWRIIWWAVIPATFVGAIFTPGVWNRVWAIGELLILPGFYFMACRKNPPKQKRAKAPIGVSFNVNN